MVESHTRSQNARNGSVLIHKKVNIVARIDCRPSDAEIPVSSSEKRARPIGGHGISHRSLRRVNASGGGAVEYLVVEVDIVSFRVQSGSEGHGSVDVDVGKQIPQGGSGHGQIVVSSAEDMLHPFLIVDESGVIHFRAGRDA